MHLSVVEEIVSRSVINKNNHQQKSPISFTTVLTIYEPLQRLIHTQHHQSIQPYE